MTALNKKIIPPEALEEVTDRTSLFHSLKEQLKWPVDSGDTFTYDIPLVGKAATRAAVSQLVPFSSGDPFAIMLVEFIDEMRRSDLREILREIKARVRKENAFGGRGSEEFVFVCASDGYKGIRFAHFKEQEKRQPKLSVFGWEHDFVDETRTLRHVNLPALAMPSLDLFDIHDWNEGKDRWMSAWNIESVTTAFYKEYKRIFKAAESLIEGISDKDDLRLFTQKLFNRLLFIRFLEKKGWLTFNGRKDYLITLLEDYRTGRFGESNFYTARLKHLFFSGLNNPQQTDLMRINNGGLLKDIIGDVPYLNGGLFDEEEDKEQNQKYPNIHVPDNAVEPLIMGLFYAYNFTVTESTPDDVEVAVDPEMLGRVFEELVTGRHESGSYYTPKPIVSFMCREALKGYLQSALPSESKEAIESFVDEHDPSGLHNPEAVLDVLRKVKVCDPACGSGAYLLGMLHELMDLRLCLFTIKHLDSRSAYDKKLEIIQTNIYGVDLDQFAVNIARLRLWLSLAVEYDRKDDEPVPPLPNLDFKIERGDSLTAPAPSGGAQMDLYRQHKIDDYLRLKAEYLMAHGNEKIALKCKVEGLRNDIAEYSHPAGRVFGFDWPVEFAEVFTPKAQGSSGGFDIVLANPPYIRQELIKELKPILKQTYNDLYCGTADLYVYFYIRALQLLKPGGMLVFISSNKWFRAKYGENLRRFIAETCSVLSITDFKDLHVFKATAYPMVFIAQRNGKDTQTILTEVKSLDPPYPDVLAVIRESGSTLPKSAISGANWTLTDSVTADRLRKMESTGIPLREYVNGRIYYGIKTGFNTAFVIDGAKREELIAADPKSAEIIKPLAVGKDIRKWHINHRDRWLIVTKIGVDIDRYPAVFKHLKRWQPELEKRWDKGNYWCELRACDYYDAFDSPKIMYPEVANSSRFALDLEHIYPLKTCFVIPVYDIYLLGVLNSSCFMECQRFTQNTVRGGYILNSSIYLERMSIPDASDNDREAISSLVQKCLNAKGVGCEEWEREIDERVAGLYGL